MNRATLSVTAAAIGLTIASSVAAAPVTTPSPKATSKPTTAKKTAAKPAPKISKWQQYVNGMLKNSAPGDEYFGRMKLSYLGINNTFRDDLVRAGAYTTDPRLLSGIGFADEALTAWASKYPNDPQLARSYFLAFQMYRKIWIQTYQDKAWQYAHIVIQKWPSSFFGKTLSKDLKIGFTEHYFADAVPCPATPEPTPSETPNRHATATPSPTPSPTPTPTPTPAPGMPPAQILPVPCFTPSPAPTIAPVATPSGSPAPIVSPSGSPSPGASTSPSPSASVSPSGSASPSATPSSSTSPSASPSPYPTSHPHKR